MQLNIQELSQHELLQEKNINWLFKNTNGEKNETYFEYRNHAKKLNITKEFDKKYSQKNKKEVNKKLNYENFCEFDNEKFDLICTGSWKANREGIFKQVPNYDTGDVDLIEASRMQIVPAEIYRNIDTQEEKVKVMFYKYQKWNEITTEKSTISIAHRIVELSRCGIDITSSNCKNMVDYFYDCLTLNDTNIIPCYKSLSRMGWHDKDFMPYSNSIKFDGENKNKYLFNALTSKGNKSDWIKFTSELRKSLFFRMQMATSFASPLIEKLNLLPFILHIWGKTGTGKTVGLIGAMSIWGNPIMGQLTKSMNNTINSVMDACAFMRNIPMALDELQAIKDKMGYDKFVMLVCEGIERGRMKYDEAKETRIWKNAFLFTGEEPIVNEFSGGGVFNRVIEVDVTGKEVIPPKRGEEIVEFYSNNYGLIAEEYIHNINKDLESIKETYKELTKLLNSDGESTTKQIMAMSLIILGDSLACKYFFPDDQPLKLKELKEYLFNENEVDVTERAYDFIKDIISINNNKFNKDNPGEIWGKITDFDIYFQRHKLTEILKEARYDFKAVQKSWSEKGYIKKDSQGRYYHNTKCHGIKSNYVIFSKVFEELE